MCEILLALILGAIFSPSISRADTLDGQDPSRPANTRVTNPVLDPVLQRFADRARRVEPSPETKEAIESGTTQLGRRLRLIQQVNAKIGRTVWTLGTQRIRPAPGSSNTQQTDSDPIGGTEPPTSADPMDCPVPSRLPTLPDGMQR